MKWTSALAIYTLVWVLSAFVVLPFHGRGAADNDVPLVKGQDQGAPARFRPGRIVVQTTVIATTIFLLYYLAYANGWADPDVITGRK